MTFYVLVCFVEFYVFFLDEIDMGGTKLIYDYIIFVNIQVKVTKDQPMVFDDGLFIWVK